MLGFVEVPRDEDSEDDSDDEENKAGDSETTEGIIAKAKEEAAKTGDEEEVKVNVVLFLRLFEISIWLFRVLSEISVLLIPAFEMFQLFLGLAMLE